MSYYIYILGRCDVEIPDVDECPSRKGWFGILNLFSRYIILYYVNTGVILEIILENLLLVLYQNCWLIHIFNDLKKMIHFLIILILWIEIDTLTCLELQFRTGEKSHSYWLSYYSNRLFKELLLSSALFTAHLVTEYFTARKSAIQQQNGLFAFWVSFKFSTSNSISDNIFSVFKLL